MKRLKCQGVGIGLRPLHLQEVLRRAPASPWFEVHICNYLQGGLNRRLLSAVAERYALSIHGVNLNLSGTDLLDRDYLYRLKQVIDQYQPALVSEHACFCAHGGRYYHDLLPVPYTGDAVLHMARRISQVQDLLGRRILLENVTRYYSYPESELTDAQFLSAVASAADCDLLLDLNNAYINQRNLGIDARQFMAELPVERIREIHLAGYSEREGVLIDSHNTAPCEPVWSLYQKDRRFNRTTASMVMTIPLEEAREQAHGKVR